MATLSIHKAYYDGLFGLWVADRSKLIDTLSILPPYLHETEDNPAASRLRDWHVPWRLTEALVCPSVVGAENLRTFIRSHVTWAEELESKVVNDSRLELAAPRTLALVCFRHTDGNDATRGGRCNQ